MIAWGKVRTSIVGGAGRAAGLVAVLWLLAGVTESRAGLAWVRDTYVITVGINDYPKGSGFPAIRYAEADARALAPALGEWLRLGPKESVHVTTLVGAEATVAHIRDALQAVATKAKPNDAFVFAFDGMGDCRAASTRYNFGAYDTQVLADGTVASPLRSRDLGVLLAQVPAREQYVVLDTCGSHQALDELHAALQPPAESEGLSVKQVHLLAPDGPSLESPKVQHGLLTAALLEGLAGAADADRTHRVTWDRLVGYVTWKLPESVPRLMAEGGREYEGPAEGLYALTIYSDAALPKAVSRSVTAEPEDPADTSGLGEDYALLVGTQHYTNGWDALNNPLRDIAELRGELVKDYGFKDDHEHIFELHDPKLAELDPMLEKLIAKKFGKNDRLLVYFAGHGHHTMLAGKPLEGYLAFADSKLPGVDGALGTMERFSDLSQKLNMVGVRHMLLVLDVCYGGLFNGMTNDSPTTFQSLLPREGEKNVAPAEELIHRATEHPSRIYITSGDETHTVSDGIPGEGSPFSQRFLLVLRQKGEGQPYIDMAHLYSRLISLERQPKAGFFFQGQADPKADFLFIPRGAAGGAAAGR